MDILFDTTKLAKTMNDGKKCDQAYGTVRSKLVNLRLGQMQAAANLAEFRLVHSRAHPLAGDLGGLWSADLDGPYRLLFVPADEPLPRKDDDGLDVSKVTSVKITGIDDTHGRNK